MSPRPVSAFLLLSVVFFSSSAARADVLEIDCSDPNISQTTACARPRVSQETFFGGTGVARHRLVGANGIYVNPATVWDPGLVLDFSYIMIGENPGATDRDIAYGNFRAGWVFLIGKDSKSQPADIDSISIAIPAGLEFRFEQDAVLERLVLDVFIGAAVHIGQWGHLGLGWRWGWASLEQEDVPSVHVPTLGVLISSRGLLPMLIDRYVELTLGWSIYQYGTTSSEPIGKGDQADIRHEVLGRWGYGVRGLLYSSPGDVSFYLGAYNDWDWGSATGHHMAGVGGELSAVLPGRVPLAFTLAGGYLTSLGQDQWVVGGYLSFWNVWIGGAGTGNGWLAGGTMGGSGGPPEIIR
ncbi:MAG: hypothetical protein JXR96_19525 [Deltaproteobacteria bacterium]|nr:hypothetical protein [Deltaproteobacteria bacterium]